MITEKVPTYTYNLADLKYEELDTIVMALQMYTETGMFESQRDNAKRLVTTIKEMYDK